MDLRMNSYQSPINDTLKEALPKEVWEDLMEYIATVPMIKNLIAHESVRGFAKDRPRMENDSSRIVVDVTNPHILEDMDFFRERAIFFDKNDKYTNIPINSNPKSEYAQFWKDEVYKWKYGMTRESDGEWIPGYLYFYWNYTPIWLVEEDKLSGKSERVKKFPKPWLGDYLWYHYMEQARSAGKHCKLLKSRGRGYEQPNSEVVKTFDGDKLVGEVKVGDKLIGIDGKETNVLEVYPQGKKDIYEVELIDGRKVKCGLDHLWYVNDLTKKRFNVVPLREMIEKGLYYKVNNGNNKMYKFKIPKMQPVEYSKKDLPIDPYVLGLLLGDGALTGNQIRIATIDQFILDEIKRRMPGYDLHKDTTNCNYTIRTLSRFGHRNPKYKNSQYGLNVLNRELGLLNLKVTTDKKFIPEIYKLSSIEQRMELLQGLMDSDGYVNVDGNKEFSNHNLKLMSDVADITRSLGYRTKLSKGRPSRQKVILNRLCNIKQEYRLHIITNDVIFKLPRKVKRCKVRSRVFKESAIINIKKLGYKEESSCFLVDNDSHTYLTRDFILTHNSFKMGSISPCNMYIYPGSGNPNFHLASDKTFLSGDKGVFGKVIDTLDWIAKHTPLPKLRLSDSKRSMEIQLGYQDEYGSRKGLLSSVYGISLKDNPDKARGIRGPLIHYEEDGLFPNLEKAWGVNLEAVEDGGKAFGLMIAGGTGGVSGKSFEGSEKLFYSPEAYHIYSLPNVYDKNTDPDNKCGFFWGAYINRNGCYDESTGESDVIKSLVEVLQERFQIKYNSSDSNAITQKKAEQPVTPAEAVLRTEGTIFPVADLKEYIDTIAPRREGFVSEHYVGKLIYTANGEVTWKPDLSIYPIRSYNKIPGDRSGALEIFEMPRKNNAGTIPSGRYIGGIDPIDADAGQSLFSVMILDTFTDRIVAEYTGRPKLAKQAYEMAYRILKFYNAQANYENNLKGLFAYFNNKNALHLLADTPQILRDMELIKNVGYGNSSKGCFANPKINTWGRLLQADWLLTKAFSNDPDDTSLNLHRLRSIGYIEELIYWNPDGNFDRVSAGIMLFILREDRIKRTETSKGNLDKQVNRIANDPYFDRNFKKQGNKSPFTKSIRGKFHFE